MNHKLIFLSIALGMFCTTNIVFGMDTENTTPLPIVISAEHHDVCLGYPQIIPKSNSGVGPEITWVSLAKKIETPLTDQEVTNRSLPTNVNDLKKGPHSTTKATLEHSTQARFQTAVMNFSLLGSPYSLDISNHKTEVKKREELSIPVYVSFEENKNRQIVAISPLTELSKQVCLDNEDLLKIKNKKTKFL